MKLVRSQKKMAIYSSSVWENISQLHLRLETNNNKYNQKLPHFYVTTRWMANNYFLWKLLVIIVVIKLYARIDIFKLETKYSRTDQVKLVQYSL